MKYIEKEDVKKRRSHWNNQNNSKNKMTKKGINISILYKRQRIAPIRYGIDEYVDTAFLGGGQIEEPQSNDNALESKLSKKWKEATDSEYKSLMKNGTWELMELPSRRKPVRCK